MLTRYEKARILSARALQISMGAPMLLKDDEGLIDSAEIAKKELDEETLPISVVRKFPNGEEEVVEIGN